MSDILVVTSKVKKVGKDVGFNTSSEVITVLSDLVKTAYLKGMAAAKRDGRRTVMARDVQPHLDSIKLSTI